MSDQTPAAAATRGSLSGDLEISAADRDLLRQLAGRVAELAGRPVEAEKRDLWYRHNALEPTPPVVFCDPENGWNEIITPDHILSSGNIARDWEMRLRKEIFWAESMCDDRVCEPDFNIAHVYTETNWGVEPTMIRPGPGGAYRWDAPIKDLNDLSDLRHPTITVDHEATQRVLDLAESTFGDLLNVQLKTSWWWSLGMTWRLILLRGAQQIMMDMVDNPEGLHRLMAFLRDGHLARLGFLEREGLLFLNNGGDYVGSGGFGYSRELPSDDFAGTVRTVDMWGFCESQETVLVSPAMFEEFVFQYQLPLLKRFGLNCYGCCEALDKRWHVVENAPQLRRVSVSAWADVADTAEKLGDRYVYSWKPNPSDLATPTFDEERIRADLRRALEATRGCRVEVIMKDNHTIGNDPQRVVRWVQIVREESERLT